MGSTMRERVLFVDDEPNILDSNLRNFRRLYDCHTAQSSAEALDVIDKNNGIDIVVTDLRMPGPNGIELLEHIREQWPDTIRILLTGYADIDIALQAINRGGVYRFLQKPFRSDDLKEVLKSAEEEFQRIHQVRVDSLTDVLTGLYNRRFLKREFARLIELSRRQEKQFSVVFADVDGLKIINDQCGHQAGDIILQSAANMLVQTCRGTDLVCRYGGDEFLIIMENAKADQAKRLIQRVLKNVEKVKQTNSQCQKFTMSLGSASFPDDGSDPERLIELADTRMYEKKHGEEGQASASVFI